MADRVASHLLIVEGNISAGKSTLTRALQERLGYRVFLEPTLSNPYLELFYAEPAKYALRMQLWLLRQRFRTYVGALRHIAATGQGVILDRSVFSDWVFAEKNRLDGTIDAAGFAYYEALRAQLLRGLPLPSVTLYLDVAPQVCFDRVHKLRGRDCESGIPLDYLAGLGDCYNEFCSEMERLGSHVLRADWNEFGSAAAIADAVRLAPPPAAVELGELLTSEQLVLERLAPPSDEPREFAEWFAAEQAEHQWDADREMALVEAAEAEAASQSKQEQTTTQQQEQLVH